MSDRAREKLRKYCGDVWYEVWRSGGNPDRVSYDRVGDHFYAGDSTEQAARSELRRQQSPPLQEEELQECPEEHSEDE